jgi:hypothetical protein
MPPEHETRHYLLRQVLVHALFAGCTHNDIRDVLLFTGELTYMEIDPFLSACGVSFGSHARPLDNISDERRKILQEFSMSDE